MDRRHPASGEGSSSQQIRWEEIKHKDVKIPRQTKARDFVKASFTPPEYKHEHRPERVNKEFGKFNKTLTEIDGMLHARYEQENSWQVPKQRVKDDPYKKWVESACKRLNQDDLYKKWVESAESSTNLLSDISKDNTNLAITMYKDDIEQVQQQFLNSLDNQDIVGANNRIDQFVGLNKEFKESKELGCFTLNADNTREKIHKSHGTNAENKRNQNTGPLSAVGKMIFQNSVKHYH